MADRRNFAVYKDGGMKLEAVMLTKYEEVASLETGQRERVPTSAEFRLIDGRALTPIDKGYFKIVETGEIVKSGDPSIW